MPQSLSNIIIHTVFSTKNRERHLCDAGLREETHKYLGGIAKSLECQPLIVGGVADHVHLLTMLSRTTAVAGFIKEIKRVSSSWLRTEKGCRDFHWQAGYGAFSVSASKVDAVREYIENQEQHHKRMTFKDEFKGFLEKHGVAFDERYMWD